MGQKVNAKIFRYGITNLWNSINYPTNTKLVDYIRYNFLFKILEFYFVLLGIKIFFYKVSIYNNVFLVYLYLYKYISKSRKGLKKKNTFKKIYN